jgi:hypothetical protein
MGRSIEPEVIMAHYKPDAVREDEGHGQRQIARHAPLSIVSQRVYSPSTLQSGTGIATLSTRLYELVHDFIR